MNLLVSFFMAVGLLLMFIGLGIVFVHYPLSLFVLAYVIALSGSLVFLTFGVHELRKLWELRKIWVNQK